MTIDAPVFPDFEPIHVAGRRGRLQRRRTRIEALAVGACVVAGLGGFMAVVGPSDTPASVTGAFVEASFAEDTSAAWALLCRVGREAHGGYAEFSERIAGANQYLMNPSDVDVDIEGTEGVNQANARGVAVAYTVTSDEKNRENWDVWGEALVVREDGRFRVCVPTEPDASR
jgi:hypothetical protein